MNHAKQQTVFACLYYFGALSRSNRPSSPSSGRKLPAVVILPGPRCRNSLWAPTDSGGPYHRRATLGGGGEGGHILSVTEESAGHEVNIRNAARRRLSRFGRGHALLNSNIPSPGLAEARDLPAF